jgi:hypothetical protein
MGNLAIISTDIQNIGDSACHLLHAGFLLGLFFNHDQIVS